MRKAKVIDVSKIDGPFVILEPRGSDTDIEALNHVLPSGIPGVVLFVDMDKPLPQILEESDLAELGWVYQR